MQNEQRLIDANALPNYKCQVTATIGDRKGPAEMRFVFWQDIEKAPTISAVPVVHGRWVKANGMMPPEYHGRKCCSVCDAFALSDFYGRERLSDFCPNCGAKMDGGATDA